VAGEISLTAGQGGVSPTGEQQPLNRMNIGGGP